MSRNYIHLVLSLIIFPFSLLCQLRTIHKGEGEDSSVAIKNISFLSAREGYFSTDKWIGYTNDSGKTLAKMSPNQFNVIFSGGLNGNLSKLVINGVMAIDSQFIYVYGHLNHLPTYLISNNQGRSYTLLDASAYFFTTENDGFKRMCYIQGTKTILAVERNRIIKIADGRTRVALRDSTRNFFDIATPSFYASYVISPNSVLKSDYDGEYWTPIAVPAGKLTAISFISAEKGWLGVGRKLYKTTTGGSSWTLVNDSSYYPLGKSMQFINDSIGFCLGDNYEVLKTVDGGKIWEKLASDIPVANGQNTHRALGTFGNELIWAGGDRGIIQSSSISGAKTIPAVKFYTELKNENGNNIIQLKNLGKTDNTYQWFKNGTPISNVFETTYVPSVGKADTIKLLAKNGQYADSLEIIVAGNTLPGGSCSANFSAATSGYTVSFGVSGMPANTKYHWNFGDGIAVNSTGSVNHTYNRPGNYLVKLTAINTSLNCSDSSQQQIQVKDSLPCPALSFQKSIVGADSLTVNFHLATNALDSAKYAWNFGDQNSAVVAQPVHRFSSYGNYQVCVTQSIGNTCKTTYCDSIRLQPPVVDPTQTATNCDNITIVAAIQSDLVRFSLIGITSTNIVSANWEFGDGSTSSDLQPQHNYVTPGQYLACVTVVTDSGCVKNLCDSININSSGVRLASVYPNPVSNNTFTLQYSAASEGSIFVELLTASGARIRYDKFNVVTGINRFNFQLSEIRKGQYYFRITENGIISFVPFIKL